jgi:hypothetical protein
MRTPARLEKIPQPGNFDDVFGRQHGGNELGLWSRMYLVEMTLAGRLRQESPDAFVQGAIEYKIGIRRRFRALAVDRRPFPEYRGDRKVDVIAGGDAGAFVWWLS